MSGVDKPLVTFALIAYNQEKYIREAVQGALAQEYSNLEIILSDDCSTDRTFEIMREMTAEYEGPHRVLARQTAANRGSLLHVAEVAQFASGKLLVLAAGDDVSKPKRVHILQQAWTNTGAWGLCSRFDRVSADGRVLEINVRPPVLDNHGFWRYFHSQEGPVHVVHGCSSAYDKRIFEHLHLQSSDYILAEDGAISVLLNLLGKGIAHLDESLVSYRENANSLTNNASSRPLTIQEIDRDERRIESFAIAQANRCKLFMRMSKQSLPSTRSLNIDGIQNELNRQQAIGCWFETSFRERFKITICGLLNRRWMVPRLFGRKIFYQLKWLRTRV